MRAIKNISRVVYKYTESQGQNTYEIYSTPTSFEAQKWIKQHKINKQFYYIIIESPQGNRGLDINGPYREKMEGIPDPIDGVNVGRECSNSGCSPALYGSLIDFKIGRSDRVLIEMVCGLCGEQSWVFLKPDYNNEQKAQCLYCGAMNTISQQWHLHFI